MKQTKTSLEILRNLHDICDCNVTYKKSSKTPYIVFSYSVIPTLNVNFNYNALMEDIEKTQRYSPVEIKIKKIK